MNSINDIQMQKALGKIIQFYFECMKIGPKGAGK